MRHLQALTLKQLRALDAVTRSRSIAGAAETLGLTPPAVHSQLKALEDYFDCPMLVRDGARRFTPTPEGTALLAAWAKITASLDTAIRRIDALQSGLAGTVVLGVVSTGKYYAPRLVAQLKNAFPEVEVVLRIGNREEILAELQAGAIDLTIMGRPPRDPPVVAHAIGDHPHVLIAPPGHRLTRMGMISPEEILSETIISREPGSGTRILMTRFLDRIGEGTAYDMVQMNSNETIKQAVIAGLGIALISLHTVTEELRAGRLVAISTPDLPIVRQWYILHRLDAPPVGAVATVLDFINAQRGAFLPRL